MMQQIRPPQCYYKGRIRKGAFLMKKGCILLLLLTLWLLPARGEEGDFAAYLRNAYGDWAVLDQSACAPSAAAVLEKEGQRTFILARQEEGAWHTAIDNPHIVSAEGWYTLLMDTDTTLFFSFFPEEEDISSSLISLIFSPEAEVWRLQSASFFSLLPVGPEDIPTETEYQVTRTENGCLSRALFLSDENDNLLAERALPPLPDTMAPGAYDLAALDTARLPLDFCGYPTGDHGELTDDAAQAFFSATAAQPGSPFAAYRFMAGILRDETLQFLLDRPDGRRILLCGAWDGQAWRFAESTPLPAGTELGFEYNGSLCLPDSRMFIGIGPYPDGAWGVDTVMGEDFYEAGPGWIAPVDESGVLFAPVLGDHPWGDITAMDWNSIPASYDEAAALCDPAAWAAPKSQDPSRRLNLRKEASTSARSLGKFYAGAPVRVLQKGKAWSRVRVGSQEGAMMNEYLAFGGEMRKLSPLLPRKAAARPITAVAWHDSGKTERLTPAEVDRLIIIGLTSDNKSYIVWDPHADRTGTVALDALYDGADG